MSPDNGHHVGKVYLVGAGPGAADLLTIRAARLLEAADIVFYDALVQSGTLDLARNARKVAVGKRAGSISTDQRFINRALVEAARIHRIVVRLKGGDPMLFGRAQEEIAALEAADIEFEVVPGITAALAASASLGISPTRRGVARSVTFATPRVGVSETTSDWQRAVAAADTAVLYMASSESASIAQSLIASGRNANTPVVVVENASLRNEQRIFTTLDALSRSQLRLAGPALLMIGDVYASTEISDLQATTLHFAASLPI
jgi:uroporphyrin-III C-methyltransferase